MGVIFIFFCYSKTVRLKNGQSIANIVYLFTKERPHEPPLLYSSPGPRTVFPSHTRTAGRRTVSVRSDGVRRKFRRFFFLRRNSFRPTPACLFPPSPSAALCPPVWPRSGFAGTRFDVVPRFESYP